MKNNTLKNILTEEPIKLQTDFVLLNGQKAAFKGLEPEIIAKSFKLSNLAKARRRRKHCIDHRPKFKDANL
ncbi:unnamed protein product [Blepharisma stoltei]|uniref:Uncharacterized protein n=1 Tax=Blepharisma stoltei TaxID=1481888 RepID=A0AAU9K250_9CILI|nr:unnamed protein product [Blepharisma stoltei]